MTITVITSFKTSDGLVYENRQQAEAHEELIHLADELYREFGRTEPSCATLAEWILKNFERPES